MLCCLGLAIAVVVMRLPPVQQTYAMYALSIIGSILATLQAGGGAVLYFLERRHGLALSMLLLAVILVATAYHTTQHLLSFYRTLDKPAEAATQARASHAARTPRGRMSGARSRSPCRSRCDRTIQHPTRADR